MAILEVFEALAAYYPAELVDNMVLNNLGADTVETTFRMAIEMLIWLPIPSAKITTEAGSIFSCLASPRPKFTTAYSTPKFTMQEKMVSGDRRTTSTLVGVSQARLQVPPFTGRNKGVTGKYESFTILFNGYLPPPMRFSPKDTTNCARMPASAFSAARSIAFV
ncbi:MAG: hypothetical protein ABSF90_15630 [Syntrophobacteraceae bacterium]